MPCKKKTYQLMYRSGKGLRPLSGYHPSKETQRKLLLGEKRTPALYAVEKRGGKITRKRKL